MKQNSIIKLKKLPTNQFGYTNFTMDRAYQIDEITNDGKYLTTKEFPELYISTELIEVQNENNIRCPIQMPSH